MVEYLKNLWNALWAKTTIDEEFNPDTTKS